FENSQGGPHHSRYRQHGRICLCRPISQPHHPMDRAGCANTRHRRLDAITRDPRLWHFNFRGPDEERLVAGRERIYLDRFWNELSANPKAIDDATRHHYAALYARPRAMHDAFEQFGAFAQDAIDNKELLANAGKLPIPVMEIGAEK